MSYKKVILVVQCLIQAGTTHDEKACIEWSIRERSLNISIGLLSLWVGTLFLGSIFSHQAQPSSSEVGSGSMRSHCFGADVVESGPSH